MSKRLSYKVFWTTFIGLMAFILVLMLLQTKFFESFYVYQKTRDLRSQFTDIYRNYAAGRYESTAKPEEVMRFEQRFYGLTAMVYKRDRKVDVYVGGYTLSAIPMVPGIPSSPNQVEIHTSPVTTFESRQEPLHAKELQPAKPTQPVQPTQPTQPAYSLNANVDHLVSALSSWLYNDKAFSDVPGSGQAVVEQTVGLDANGRPEKILVAAAKLPDGANPAGGDAYLFALATLAPVGDAVAVMGRFYVYFIALALLLIGLFALLFSRTIARPLVRLNRVAKRLAKLDFSTSVNMERKDEIGQLAGTMNSLARNLQQTMGELRDANAKLTADIEREKQLERLRKRFVASVSHELKTPVSLIQGYAEALKDNVGQGLKRDRYAGIIIEESERMARLVNDMLDLSQLESGGFKLDLSSVPLLATIRSVLDKLVPLLDEKRLRPRLLHEEAEVWVNSDRQRLQQVLLNLLGNAVRHAPAEGRLEVKVASAAPEQAALVEIYNEGDPIPAADLPHIWDVFYRSDRSGNRELGGTGIGLSIVKQVLQLHGSEFGARNEHGGVTFYFTLPVVPGGHSDAKRPADGRT